MVLFPYERHNPIRHAPWMLRLLVGSNTIVFVITYWLLDWGSVVTQYGFIPAAPRLETLFTSMFLHAGVLHLAGNMFFLHMFGDNVEDLFGPIWFLLFYLICGLAATWCHSLFAPGSSIPCVGASGAIAGVLGMYAVFFPHAQVDVVVTLRAAWLKTIHSRAYAAIPAYLVIQCLLGLLSLLPPFHRIASTAFWAHVGGLVFGLLLAAALRWLGVCAPLPHEPVRIERPEKLHEIWCPHCGREWYNLDFGDHRCSDCGCRLEICPTGDTRTG